MEAGDFNFLGSSAALWKESSAVFEQITAVKPLCFISLHNGRHRQAYEIFSLRDKNTDTLIEEINKNLSIVVKTVSQPPLNCGAEVLASEKIAPVALCFECLHILAHQDCRTHHESYVRTGRELLTGLAAGLNKIF